MAESKQKQDVRERYTCPKCGSHDIRIGRTELNNKTSIYCDSCNTFISFVKNPAEKREIYKMLLEDSNDEYALKVISRYGNNTTIRCEICGCPLYSSTAPQPKGQFDLINANFCPICGAEFMEKQKMMMQSRRIYLTNFH